MNKFIFAFVCALAALALGGCSGREGSAPKAGGEAERVPFSAADSRKLAGMLDENNLGARVAWFDKNFDLVAKRITREGAEYRRREYEFGQCAAEVEEKQGAIVAITAYVSDACVVAVPFFDSWNSKTSLEAVTQGFRDMKADVPHFMVHCWNSCGGSTEPDFQLLWAGAAVNNGVDLVLHFGHDDGVEQWEGGVLKQLKRDVPPDDDDVVNCTRAFDKAALETWGTGNGRIEAITISSHGRYAEGLPVECGRRHGSMGGA